MWGLGDLDWVEPCDAASTHSTVCCAGWENSTQVHWFWGPSWRAAEREKSLLNMMTETQVKRIDKTHKAFEDTEL